jgi:hypothetical protein
MGIAVQTMTGAPFFDTYHNEIGIDELWDNLDRKLKNNWMVTAASF